MTNNAIRAIAIKLCILLVFQSYSIASQAVMPDPDSDLLNRPDVQSAPNGIPVVNIVAPTPGGVSHNKYVDFSVRENGLILNNSTDLVKTDLAGYILGNPNIQGRSARLILNEVTSTNRSHLNGVTEVAGTEADVVIANPNGISVDGAGFLNIPRVTLTTGTPRMKDGMLDRIVVENGSVEIIGKGLNALDVDTFSIVTRALNLNADLHANALNIVLGRNDVNAQSFEVISLLHDDNSPLFALDASALGGMYAESIRLIGTESGVGVRMAGNMAASAGGLVLSNRGFLDISGRVVASENMELTTGWDLDVSGSAVSGQDLSLQADSIAVTGDGEIIAGQDLGVRSKRLVNEGLIASIGTSEFEMYASLENIEGMIFSVGDMSISGPSFRRKGFSLVNAGGTIETWNGNIAIEANRVINQSLEEPVIIREDYSIEGEWVQDGNWKFKDIQDGFIETIEYSSQPTAKIVSGRGINISVDELHNEFGLISANDDMELSGRLLNNVGLDAIHEWTVTTQRQEWFKKHRSAHINCKWQWGWRASLVDGPNVEILDGVYGIIEAGQNLTINFGQEVNNGRTLVGVLTNKPSLLPEGLDISLADNVSLAPGWNLLFQQAPEGLPYLIETRPEFAEMSGFVNSGYLLEQLGYMPDSSMRRLGDGHYETRLIRDEIIEETGRRFLTADYTDEKEQFLALMDAAADVAPELELEVGIALKPEQVEMLTRDIVWLVEEEVYGEKVLVPRLYLSRLHDENILSGSQIVADGDLSLVSEGLISNAGRIRSGRDLSIDSRGEFVNRQGEVVAGAELEVKAGQDVSIEGGKFRGRDVLITAENVNVETVHQTNEHAWGHNTVVGKAAAVEAEDSIIIQAANNIDVTGAEIEGGQVSLSAAGDVEISSISDSFSSTAYFDGGYEKLEKIRQVQSSVSGEKLSVEAGRDVVITASTLDAEENLKVSAGDSLNVTSVEERDSREFRMKQSSGFDSKTVYTFDESVRQAESSLTSGGNLTVRAGINEVPGGSGQIGIRGSRLHAVEDLSMEASGSIAIEAAEEKDVADSFVRKNNAVSRKETRNRTEENFLKQTDVISGGDMVIRSGEDINALAGNFQADGDMSIAAGNAGDGSLNMLAGEKSTETLNYSRKSGIDIDISDDFLSFASEEQDRYRTTSEQDVATTVMAAGDVRLSAATDVNMAGVEVVSGDDLALEAGRDVNISGGVTEEGRFEEHSEKKFGLAVDADQDSVGVFAGYQEENDKLAGTGQTYVGSSLVAGNDLSIRSGQNILQAGSDLTSGRDVRLDADGDIRSLAGEEVSNLYQYHEQLRVGISAGIQHNLGSALDAAESVDDGNDLLTGASRTLKAVDAINGATQPSFDMHFGAAGFESESNRSRSESRVSAIVAGRDLMAEADGDVAFEGTVAIAERDIRLAGENVRLLAATSQADVSEENRRFKAGLAVQGSSGAGSFSLGISGSGSEYVESIVNATPVLLRAGRDIEVNAAREIEMEGTQAMSNEDLNLVAGENLDIHAAEGRFVSDFDSFQFGAETGLGASLTGGAGLFVSISGGHGSLNRDNTQTVNANLEAGKDMHIQVGGDASIRGANLSAETVHADIEGNLLVSSISDTGSADGERWSAGVTVSVGGASGISENYGETEGEKDWIATQTSIVARNQLDIEVGGHTQLDAALIASESGDLNLDTETFAYSDFYGIDREESYDVGFGFNGIGGGPATRESGADVNETGGNWSVDGGYSNRDRRQIVRATIGAGEIIVRSDEVNESDSISGLNRDVEKAYEITRDDSDGVEIYASGNSIESVANYDETLAKWKYAANNYGYEIIEATRGVDLITRGSKWAKFLVEKLDPFVFGIEPTRRNEGGIIAQLPYFIHGGDKQETAFQVRDASNPVVLENPDLYMPVEDIPFFNELAEQDRQRLEGLLITKEPVAMTSENATYQNFTNGMMNTLSAAVANASQQTGADVFTVNYNPTHGFVSDLLESGVDKIFGNEWIHSGQSVQTGYFTQDVILARGEEGSNFVMHSQGNLLMNAGLTLLPDNLANQPDKEMKSKTSYFSNGSPVLNDTLLRNIQGLGMEYTGSNVNAGDAVGEVLGGNYGIVLFNESSDLPQTQRYSQRIESLVSNSLLLFRGDKYPEFDNLGTQVNVVSPHSNYGCIINCGSYSPWEKVK